MPLLRFFLVFFSGEERAETDRIEWVKYLRAFNEHYPGEARKALLTPNEKRRFLERHKISKPDGAAYGEQPIVKFPPVARASIARFSRKMVLAFHYKHSGLIAPADAWIKTRFWTNLRRVTNAIPQELFNLVPRDVELRRDNISLGNQFSYKFDVSTDGKIGAYMAEFRRTFTVMGLLCFDSSLMEDVEEGAVPVARMQSGARKYPGVVTRVLPGFHSVASGLRHCKPTVNRSRWGARAGKTQRAQAGGRAADFP